ncbi:Sodium-dependent neutral amino acid transporter B(0)AT3 [Colletotrichum chlorophyti]|uniref:Sodium-dependent neutral amino acid transporter B(0)AT3 n=1 Tax=Colletotrichum chlorophyti TaxID=708187 RepID=A0A1Q8RFI4_9PEZI|nr:Sodium-dependent neutral amino acid transporter B(0)AT3 [Colletotrichum chlorophyti]
MGGLFRKCLDKFAPPANKSSDGRDAWGSRRSFIIASMGGAVGFGSLLRYPSIVYNNNGLQFFIPYLMALVLLAIPTLMLEIAIGQAFRAGCVVAWHTANKRAKGVGFGVIYNGYAVTIYFVPMIAWILKFFRYSFQSSLQWEGRTEEFYNNQILEKVDAIPGEIGNDGSVLSYTSYPGTAVNGETLGWTIFTWVIMWLCVFRGVGLTGRVVYFTLGIPLVLIIILVGRSAALPNAIDGVRMYMGHFDASQLASATLWQEACGQIFFSAGIGMGYYTSYASYNAKYSNAVQDAVIIGFCNMTIEVLAAFAVFSVVGYLGMSPETDGELDSFTAAFLTYPEALAQMPGAQFWAVIFFATLFLLGMSSAFAMLEAMITGVIDTDWGKRWPRPAVVTVIMFVSMLISIPFTTEFGYDMLVAADTWVNYLALFFIVWAEANCATSLYRYQDVVDQCGLISYVLWIVGLIGGQVGGFATGHAVSPHAGAGVGFGIFVGYGFAAVLLAKTPKSEAPRFWGTSGAIVRKFWWLAFYQGNQLRRDLNAVIGNGKNWTLPFIFGPVLRYITAPIIGMLFSMAYPRFYSVRMDPLNIVGFAFMHVVLITSFVGLIMPRWFNILVPRNRINDGTYPVAPGMILKRANAENDFADGISDEETVIPSGRGSNEKIDGDEKTMKRSSSDLADTERGMAPRRPPSDKNTTEQNKPTEPELVARR